MVKFGQKFSVPFTVSALGKILIKFELANRKWHFWEVNSDTNLEALCALWAFYQFSAKNFQFWAENFNFWSFYGRNFSAIFDQNELKSAKEVTFWFLLKSGQQESFLKELWGWDCPFAKKCNFCKKVAPSLNLVKCRDATIWPKIEL